MGKRRDWSELTEETAREYYLENYEDMIRSELQKEDSGFYSALQSRGFLDILPESTLRAWSELTEETAREYYLEHFEGMSRGELSKEDSGFYKALYKRGLLDVLPKTEQSHRRDWSDLTEETARAYYLEHYEGMSRLELRKEDVGFYNALRKRGLVDILPESKNLNHQDWSWLNEDTARDYYLEHFEGRGRRELSKDEAGNGFYKALQSKGLLDIAFRPFYNMEEFQEHLEESGLLEDLFDDGWVKDVDKFSEFVKEYCKYNCQTIKLVGDELGMKKLSDKLNSKAMKKLSDKLNSKATRKLHPEDIDLITKYMQNPENDRWKEYSLESEL